MKIKKFAFVFILIFIFLNLYHIRSFASSTKNLPHVDSNGNKYITYDDFGAKCDGVYDDMIAIRKAHNFANSNNCEVHATSGNTYYIFNYTDGPVSIRTNVDWNNANFIIHDEELNNRKDANGKDSSSNYIFTITSNYNDITTLENPSITLNKSTKKVSGIEDTLSTLNNSKEYKNIC